jgi:hypothetical protein
MPLRIHEVCGVEENVREGIEVNVREGIEVNVREGWRRGLEKDVRMTDLWEGKLHAAHDSCQSATYHRVIESSDSGRNKSNQNHMN